MKISTARRIVHAKKGKFSEELVAQARAVCEDYHRKLAAEKAIVDQFVAQAVKGAIEKGLSEHVIEQIARDAREHGERALRHNRQQAYKERPLECYVLPNQEKDGKVLPAVRDPNLGTRLRSEVMQPRDPRDPRGPHVTTENRDQ